MTAMKWWGWGREDVSFTHEDKPDLAPFIREQLQLDVTKPGTEQPREFAELDLPEPRLPGELRGALETAVGHDCHVIVQVLDGSRDLQVALAGVQEAFGDQVDRHVEFSVITPLRRGRGQELFQIGRRVPPRTSCMLRIGERTRAPTPTKRVPSLG